MTEQQRMDREALLKRAAAAAGAVYFAPVLTSAASADVAACKGKCKNDTKCFNKGGAGCRCVIKSGKKKGKCKVQQQSCGADDRCSPGTPCDVAQFCNSSQTCICFVPIPGDGTSRDCVDFPSNFCSDYPPCSKADGSGCSSGSCCLDTCCPEGICSPPCSSGAAPRISRAAGSGATLTL
jgi:hypothetical protein